MDAIRAFLDVLPPQMRDPVLFAIPFFLLLLIIEWTAARKLEHLEPAHGEPGRPPSGAYMKRDAWASISMGLVSVATTAGWTFIALLGYAAIYAYLAPWHLASGTITWSTRTVPDGSRKSGSAPAGVIRRRIWSAVHFTVATVVMPSRW